MGLEMIPKRMWLAILLTIFTLSACESDTGDSVNESSDEEEVSAIPVEVAIPTRGDISASYSGTAPIEAFADATVIAKAGGEVREILVEEGDNVSIGQVLARLDGDRLRLEMQEAEANLQKLQRDYQRNIDLKDKSLISDGDFEKILFDMDALQAAYDLAKLEYGYTEIRAPIAGVISERFIKIGNTIDVNAETFEVTSLDPLISYLHVPEREFRRIRNGQNATISIDALADTTFEGTVARISPVVDPQTGTFKITIEVNDETRILKPGMFGRIDIVHDVHTNALLVPRSAVIEAGGESSIFVVAEDVASRRVVATGFSDNGQIEIIEGIADNDQVVVVGQTSLKDGSKISIIDAAANTASPVGNDAVAE